jgi:hypothetical protein
MLYRIYNIIIKNIFWLRHIYALLLTLLYSFIIFLISNLLAPSNIRFTEEIKQIFKHLTFDSILDNLFNITLFPLFVIGLCFFEVIIITFFTRILISFFLTTEKLDNLLQKFFKHILPFLVVIFYILGLINDIFTIIVLFFSSYYLTVFPLMEPINKLYTDSKELKIRMWDFFFKDYKVTAKNRGVSESKEFYRSLIGVLAVFILILIVLLVFFVI